MQVEVRFPPKSVHTYFTDPARVGETQLDQVGEIQLKFNSSWPNSSYSARCSRSSKLRSLDSAASKFSLYEMTFVY